jgi:hypothetical protein
MRKALCGLLLWGFCVILLFNIGQWANSGNRGVAVAGIVLLLAVVYFGNKLISGKGAGTDTIAETGNAPARPKRKRKLRHPAGSGALAGANTF